ncbi:MAG TPA: hypothetical protein VFT72_06370 [Opitutaceae bacterium]|nr:hypothetical protein [Opitutaceae bacterium]
MGYPYTRHQINELVQASKRVRTNTRLEVSRRGELGAWFDVNLDLADGGFVDLRYLGKATDVSQPSSYESNFILAGYRVRGVGHNFVARNNLRSKQRIPAGWHQNRCDPNLPTSHVEYNRHEPLPEFAPTDFGDFIAKCAKLWAIDLAMPEVLL